jgi:glucose-1-phosphate thymidylyltransferase
MKKSCILAGGFGTRLKPFTKRLNKGLAPIYTKDGAIPQIIFPLNTLINSGSSEIMIITSREHCGQLVELLGDGSEYNCNLTYRIQEMNRPVVGIAQALGLVQDFVCNEDAFGVILGDNYYEESFKDTFDAFEVASFKNHYSCLSDTKKRYPAVAHVFLKEVNDAFRFGVATLNCNKVVKIVEKPQEPESPYAVTGLYLYTPHVFEILPTLVPSKRKELEITDINNFYVNNGGMTASTLTSFWHDMGTPEAARETENFIWKDINTKGEIN